MWKTIAAGATSARQRDAAAAIAIGIFSFHAPRDHRQLAVGLFDRDVGFQPTCHVSETASAQ